VSSFGGRGRKVADGSFLFVFLKVFFSACFLVFSTKNMVKCQFFIKTARFRQRNGGIDITAMRMVCTSLHRPLAPKKRFPHTCYFCFFTFSG
jgi:hypothetical protein